MSRNIPPVTGMKDVLSADIGLWQHVERSARAVPDNLVQDDAAHFSINRSGRIVK